MKNAVLTFLRKNPNQHFNTRQIARHLKLKSGDYKNLRQELKRLVMEGKVILNPEARYSACDENKVLKGLIRIHPDGYGFLLPESSKKTDVFVPARHLNWAMNGDTVLVASRRNKRDGRYEGRVVQILQRAHPVIVGKIHKQGHKYWVKAFDLGPKVAVSIPASGLGKAADGDLVAVKLVQYPGPGVTAVGEVIRVIGEEISDKNLTDMVLIKNQIRREFGRAVKQELKKLPDEVKDGLERDRRDLTHLPIITIDGITARDFDDAICVVKRGRSTVLYVCVADVSEYVKPGSALDQEAYRRGTATYLPDECIPMIPERLSNGLCSLNPYKLRLTLTAEIHYNDRGEFIRAEFYKSVIRSVKRATYEEVEAFFDGTGGEDLKPEVRKSLKLARQLAVRLCDQAKRRGALGFDLPEAEVVYDRLGNIITIQKARRFFSHKLIEVFMVAANMAVAQLFTVYGLPLLYRVHERPDPLKVQNFLELVHNLGLGAKLKGFHPAGFFEALKGHRFESFLQLVFLRSLKQALYAAKNEGHYGLALTDYCHFTSPIRRYPDLVVHRQLKSLLKGSVGGVLSLKRSDLNRKQNPLAANRRLTRGLGTTLYDFGDLKVIGQHCSKKERDAMESEREILNIRRAIFIKDRLHEKFFGSITKVTRYGLVVELDPYFIEGFLSLSALEEDYYEYDEKRVRLLGRRHRGTYRIGDRIWVRVTHVRVETAEITLELAEQRQAGGKKKKKRKRKR